MKKIETILRKCSIVGDKFLLTTKTKRKTNSLYEIFSCYEKKVQNLFLYFRI